MRTVIAILVIACGCVQPELAVQSDVSAQATAEFCPEGDQVCYDMLAEAAARTEQYGLEQAPGTVQRSGCNSKGYGKFECYASIYLPWRNELFVVCDFTWSTDEQGRKVITSVRCSAVQN